MKTEELQNNRDRNYERWQTSLASQKKNNGDLERKIENYTKYEGYSTWIIVLLVISAIITALCVNLQLDRPSLS